MLQREQAIRKLAWACADGRLTPAELSDRTEEAQRAVSYEELGRVLADLPGPGEGAVAGRRRGARRWLTGFLGICASSHFPALRPQVRAVAVAGEVIVDLTRTPLTSFDTQLTAIAVAGGEVRIIAPAGVRLQVTDASGAACPDPAAAGPLVPTVRVRAMALLGGVRIEHVGRRVIGPRHVG